MKKTTWQLQTAKNRFSELISKAASGEPQMVTRNGKSVAYVIDVDTFDRKVAGNKSKKSVILSMPHKDITLIPPRDRDGGREFEL